MSEAVVANWAPDAVRGKMSKASKPGFWGAAALSLALHLSVAALLAVWTQGREKEPAPITVDLAGFGESQGKGNARTVASRHSAGREDRRSARRPAGTVSEFCRKDVVGPAMASPETGLGQGENTGASAEAPGQGNQAGGQYLEKNFIQIRDRIRDCLVYPSLARKLGWQGEAVVAFVIGPDGYGSEITLVQSCGHKVLDQNVIRAIHEAEPFPQPGERVRLVLPVAYKLVPDSRE
jgi:TonB family protein